MKSFIIILLFIAVSAIKGAVKSFTDIHSMSNEQVTISCPPNHEKAKESLKEYLEKDKTIDDLHKNYGLDIDKNSHKRIQALQEQVYKSTCEKLIKDLADDEYKSVYKVSDSFFVVTFDINNKGEYEFKYISIYNIELDLIVVYFGSIF